MWWLVEIFPALVGGICFGALIIHVRMTRRVREAEGIMKLVTKYRGISPGQYRDLESRSGWRE